MQVRSVGVCGSDVHYYKEGRIGSFVVERPIVLGHEVSGVVVDVGADVPHGAGGAAGGDRAAAPLPALPRLQGRSLQHVLGPGVLRDPPVDGAFCDYVVAPADFAYPVPDDVSDHAAALLEPLSVGLWACEKAKVGPGSRVLVTGAGPIGALAALAARARGAAEVVVTDLVPSRRERILSFGATTALDPADPTVDLSALGVDAFIECSGATPALISGLHALRESGTAVLVGLGAAEITIPVQLIAFRELVLTGVFRYVDTWPAAIAAARQPGTDLDGLVTAEFELEDTEAALTSDDDPASMKSVVVVSRA